MEPITITIISISMAVGAAATTWATWDKILTTLKGKKIAVLGARGVGKTTLLTYLDMIDMQGLEMEQTRSPDSTRSSSIDLNVRQQIKSIRFKSTVDLPGSEIYRDNGTWDEAFKVADIVLYFVNAAALLRGIDKSSEHNSQIKPDEIKRLTQKRVEDDLKNIQEWLKKSEKRKPHIFIIGNHFDEIDEDFKNSKKIINYQEEFEKKQIISKNSIGMKIVIGSLKTRDSMRDMLEEIVKIMEVKR